MHDGHHHHDDDDNDDEDLCYDVDNDVDDWTLANEDLRNNSVHRSQRRHTVGRTSCQRVERWQEKKKRNKRLTRKTQSAKTS